MLYEALMITVKWRDNANNDKEGHMKFSEFSSFCGVPRKTLDDYFYTFRKGIHLNYNFVEAIIKQVKMGDLRKYI